MGNPLLDLLSGRTQTDSGMYIQNAQLIERLDELQIKTEELEESLLEVADAFDNYGWSPLEAKESREMSLDTVKKISEISRAVNTANPFVKRGVNARIGYIWGNGVEFEDISDGVKELIKKNRKTMFSQQAYEERERAAATDGNVFTALHKEDGSMFRVPLAQIFGCVMNPDNTEEIWFYKRQWKTRTTTNTDGVEKEKDNTRWYPSMAYARKMEEEGRELPKRWGKFGVDQNYVIQHDAVNKQVGWRWGVPDIMAVLFFAKVYKEYLEDNVTMVKAFSQIALQIKNPSSAGANSSAAQWQTTPMRDPVTGEATRVGAAAFTGVSTQIEATGLNASGVDFTTGSPLAAAIASGLEVSLDVILSSSENSGAGSTLDLPTLKAMEARQKLWTNSFLDLFEFWNDDDAKIIWRNIDEDETHRRIQSVQLAYDGGLLHQEEARKETLEMLRIVPTSPEMPIAPDIVAAEVAADNAVKVAAAKPVAGTKVPGQGRSGSVGSVNSGRGQVKAAVKKSMVNK